MDRNTKNKGNYNSYDKDTYKHLYVASWLCGNVTYNNPRTGIGSYDTTIQIYAEDDTKLKMQSSLNFPPSKFRPGESSKVVKKDLNNGKTIGIDCEELNPEKGRFKVSYLGSGYHRYFHGIITIYSDTPLIVWQTTTVQDASSITQSISQNFVPASLSYEDNDYAHNGYGNKGDQYGKKGSSYNNQYGNKGSSYNNQYGNKGSSHNNQYGKKGSSYNNQYGSKASSHNNQYSNKDYSNDHQYGSKGSSHNNQYSNKDYSNNNQYGNNDYNSKGQKNNYSSNDSDKKTSTSHQYGRDYY